MNKTPYLIRVIEYPIGFDNAAPLWHKCPTHGDVIYTKSPGVNVWGCEECKLEARRTPGVEDLHGTGRKQRQLRLQKLDETRAALIRRGMKPDEFVIQEYALHKNSSKPKNTVRNEFAREYDALTPEGKKPIRERIYGATFSSPIAVWKSETPGHVYCGFADTVLGKKLEQQPFYIGKFYTHADGVEVNQIDDIIRQIEASLNRGVAMIAKSCGLVVTRLGDGRGAIQVTLDGKTLPNQIRTTIEQDSPGMARVTVELLAYIDASTIINEFDAIEKAAITND